MSSGMPVIATTRARQSPIRAPTNRAATKSTKPVEVESFHSPDNVSQMVAEMAMAIPAIP